jgi:hypothetical protein
MNAIMAIHPYRHNRLWVFDDPAVGLREEPFISGADDIIDRMVQHIPEAEWGFTLLFSAAPFPGHQLAVEWRREEFGGHWYYAEVLDMEGWLCPALFRYFEEAPKMLYAQFKERPMPGLR